MDPVLDMLRRLRSEELLPSSAMLDKETQEMANRISVEATEELVTGNERNAGMLLLISDALRNSLPRSESLRFYQGMTPEGRTKFKWVEEFLMSLRASL